MAAVLGGRERTAFLLEVGRRLAASLDHERTFRELVDFAVPQMADLSVLHVIEAGKVRLVGVAARDPSLRRDIEAFLARRPVSLDDPFGSGFVMRTGEVIAAFDVPPELLERAAADEEQRLIYRRVAPRSSIVVPLRARDRVLGALSLALLTGERRFGPDDLEVAQDVAARAAIALENAELFRAEREARAEAERARVLVEAQSEASIDGIYFQGVDQRTAWYNQRLLQLWDIDATIPALATLEQRMAAVVDRLGDPEAFFRVVREAESEPDRIFRFDVAKKGGQIFDCYSAPVLAPDGTRLGRIWSYRDVTEQRAIESALAGARRELAEREKLSVVGTLVSGVAHEIRTPLTYVSNHAHLIERLAAEARAGGGAIRLDRLEESARAIHEGVERMNRLVLELRRFGRREEPGDEACEVDAAVRAATDLFQATYRGRLDLRTRWGGAGRAAMANLQLQQVVLNLLENAADASPAGGTVEVETARDATGPVVRVRDRGAGIPPGILERMWEPFFTTKKEGTGLGLSIVRRLIETANGRIEVETVPGVGTTFTVHLAPPPARARAT